MEFGNSTDFQLDWGPRALNMADMMSRTLLRCILAVSVMVLCFVGARGENAILSLLGEYRDQYHSDYAACLIDESFRADVVIRGQVYTNALFVTNDSLHAVLKHDGGKSEVMISDMPWRYRAICGIHSEVDKEYDRSLNVFLAQHRDSDSSVERDVRIFASDKNARKRGWGLWFIAAKDEHSWSLSVTASRYYLSGYTWEGGEIVRSASMQFSPGQETVAKNVFSKFLEWEAIASATDAEPFEKVLMETPVPFQPGEVRTFTFSWKKEPVLKGYEGQAVLEDSAGYVHSGYLSCPCCKHDVVCFLDMVQFLSDMKGELVGKIGAGKGQKELFK